MRRLEPSVLQVEIVHDSGDLVNRDIHDAKAIAQDFKRAPIAFVLEPARLIHVKGHGFGPAVWRRREQKRRFGIDESTDEPGRRESVNAWSRTREPLTMLKVARIQSRLLRLAGRPGRTTPRIRFLNRRGRGAQLLEDA